MTTPELLAEIDNTLAAYEASKVNQAPMQVLTDDEMIDAHADFVAMFDANQITWVGDIPVVILM